VYCRQQIRNVAMGVSSGILLVDEIGGSKDGLIFVIMGGLVDVESSELWWLHSVDG